MQSADRKTLHLNWEKSRLEAIPGPEVWRVWPEVKKLLAPAVKRMETHAEIDVLRNLLERDWQLWISRNGSKVEAACITQINACPKMKICRILLNHI